VREKMVSEDLKYEQLDKSKYHTFIGHTTAIAIKAVPLVASCTPSADGLIDKVNSVWQWKAFLPISDSANNDNNNNNFDIWDYLISENSFDFFLSSSPSSEFIIITFTTHRHRS
jgi:hypothetical protein